MNFVKVQIRNLEKLEKLGKSKDRFSLNIGKLYEEQMWRFAKMANENLLSKITNRTPRDLTGHGISQVGDVHLADNPNDLDAWEIVENEKTKFTYRGILRNTCEHAAAVELGVKHEIKPKNGPFLILGYQGGDKSLKNAITATSVKGQKGYGFVQQALDNKTFRNSMEARLRDALIKELIGK